MIKSNQSSYKFNKNVTWILQCRTWWNLTPKYLSKQLMKSDLTEQKEKYTPKVMHGYYGGD